MDLRYADLRPGLHGLGVHRGALFSALRAAAEEAGARLHAGVEVTWRRGGVLGTADGDARGPYDLIGGADGAPPRPRTFLGVRARVHEHRWGALWGVFADPDGAFGGVLDQYFDGTRRMAGFLPTGAGAVSLFWSVRLDRIAALRAAGLPAFAADLASLAPPTAALLPGLR